jgi:hypothetical protein
MSWFEESLTQDEKRRFALILSWLGVIVALGITFSFLWGIVSWAID